MNFELINALLSMGNISKMFLADVNNPSISVFTFGKNRKQFQNQVNLLSIYTLIIFIW